MTIEVTPIDDAPEVVTPIEDLLVDEDIENQVIDTTELFVDSEEDEITLEIFANSNEELLTATLEGTLLTIDFSIMLMVRLQSLFEQRVMNCLQILY